MEESFFDTLPHGNDLDAVSGYRYIGEPKDVLSFWAELLENESIHTGTNFDLSGDIENIDRTKKLYILYDFMHRVMLYYYEPGKDGYRKELSLDDFKKYIGVW